MEEKEEALKILDTRWFCGSTNVGIVRALDDYDGVKYYISAFNPSTEEKDAEYIADYGSSFPKHAGDVLFDVDGVTNGDYIQIPLNREHAEAMARVALYYLAETKNEKDGN